MTENQSVNSKQQSPNPIIFTDACARKVASLITEEENPNLKLKVYVIGGGCSGFQYGFTFAEEIETGDVVIENDGVKLLIDPFSFSYLVGATIDYQENLEGSRFIISNPNAKVTCSCGSSFST